GGPDRRGEGLRGGRLGAGGARPGPPAVPRVHLRRGPGPSGRAPRGVPAPGPRDRRGTAGRVTRGDGEGVVAPRRLPVTKTVPSTVYEDLGWGEGCRQIPSVAREWSSTRSSS